MRFVMFTFTDPDDAATWEQMSAEEQEADVERHRAWFAKYRDKVVGGEELDYPPIVKSLRPGRQSEGPVVTDGPFVETKEILGGFVIVEAADLDEAVRMAAEWPSLSSMPNATVQVQPVFVRD
jgi:hypothetical protein